MKVDSHESFRQLTSNMINSGQTITKVVESPSRVTTNERKLSSTLLKQHEHVLSRREHTIGDESIGEFQSFRPKKTNQECSTALYR